MRRSLTSLIASVFLSAIVLVHAEDAPDHATAGQSPDAVTGNQSDGTLDFSGGSIAAGIGFVWGHGELNYGGQSHSFKISGLSIVDVGAANISASGQVYNLKSLADFNGNYVDDGRDDRCRWRLGRLPEKRTRCGDQAALHRSWSEIQSIR